MLLVQRLTPHSTWVAELLDGKPTGRVGLVKSVDVAANFFNVFFPEERKIEVRCSPENFEIIERPKQLK